MNPQIYGYLMEKLFNERRPMSGSPDSNEKEPPGNNAQRPRTGLSGNQTNRNHYAETSTLGIRSRPVFAPYGDREIIEFDSSLGRAKAKIKRFGDDIVAVSPEYDDAAGWRWNIICPCMRLRAS